MSLQLDGGTTFRGTEFVKLLATGSSNLATEAFVNEAVANGGGGSGGSGTTDLSNYYNKSEVEALFTPYYTKTLVDNLFTPYYNRIQVDNLLTSYYTEAEANTLLDTKLNVNNPQDISGTLRLGHIDGLSKIILNSVGSNGKDFYVNGDAQVNGNHLVQSLDSSGYIKGSNIQTNSFNALNTNDILFKSNNDTYLQYDVSENKIIANKLIQCGGNLKTQEIDTIANLDLVIKRNGVDFITLTNGEIQFNQPTNLVFNPDLSNCVKLTGETSQTIAGDVVVGGTFNANTLNSNGNSDLVLQRNGIEYMKLEGTLQQVEFSKNVASNIYNSVGNANVSFRRNAIDFFYLRNNQVELNSGITLQSSSAKLDTINTAGDNDMVFKRNDIDFMAFSQATGKIFLQKDTEIQGDVNFVAGKTVQVDNINTVGNNDLALQRNGVEFMKFGQVSNEIECDKTLLIAGGLGKTDIYESLETGDTNNILRIWNRETTKNPITIFGLGANSNIFSLYTDKVIAKQPINCNTINTDGNSDLIFKRNSNTYMTFNQADDRIELEKSLKLPLNPSRLEFTSCYMRESIASNSLFDFVQENSDGVIRFFVGDLLNTNMPLYLNSSVVRIGENHTLLTNAMNTVGDVDLIFQRNSVEYMRFINTANIDNVDVVSIPTGKGISAEYSYANFFRSRSVDTDLVFHGGNVAGNNRVEFMRYNRTGESLDLNCALDNTGKSIVGNLVDTSISDEKLKKNIEDVDVDVSDIVKKINVKSFEYKNEKFGVGKQIGFLANQLLDELPEVFSKNIIGKDREDNLNMNYIKINVLLWKALQEEIHRREQIESKLFEMMNDIEELKKNKPKPKAKSKSKN